MQVHYRISEVYSCDCFVANKVWAVMIGLEDKSLTKILEWVKKLNGGAKFCMPNLARPCQKWHGSCVAMQDAVATWCYPDGCSRARKCM